MKKTLLTFFLAVSGVFSTYAQIGSVTTSIGSSLASGNNAILSIIALLQKILARLVPLSVGVAMLAFFWFLIVFIWKAVDNPDEQKKAKAGMFWSLLAIFIMVSIWGIIGFFGNILGIGQGGSMPTFKLPGEI